MKYILTEIPYDITVKIGDWVRLCLPSERTHRWQFWRHPARLSEPCQVVDRSAWAGVLTKMVLGPGKNFYSWHHSWVRCAAPEPVEVWP